MIIADGLRYDLLAELAAKAGPVATHEELLNLVWGQANPGSPWVIGTQLIRLRQKLGEDGENLTYIFAEPRVGYRMGMDRDRGRRNETGYVRDLARGTIFISRRNHERNTHQRILEPVFS